MLAWLREGLRRLDAFTKVHADVVEGTPSGGAITLVAAVTMAVLLLVEVYAFIAAGHIRETSMDVDAGSVDDRMTLRLDVTAAAAACASLRLEVLDSFGEPQARVDHHVTARPLGAPESEAAPLPIRCGSCRPPQGFSPDLDDASLDDDCCNTCDEVRSVHRAHGIVEAWQSMPQCRGIAVAAWRGGSRTQAAPGCRVSGTLTMARAAGHVQLYALDWASDLHTALPPGPRNNSHVVHAFAFGESFAGRRGALDGSVHVERAPPPGAAGRALEDSMPAMEYFLTIVPVTYVGPDRGSPLTSYDFSVAEHAGVVSVPDQGGRRAHMAWSISWTFELSPVAIRIADLPRSWLGLASAVVAIIGGGVTVAAMCAALVHAVDDARAVRGFRRRSSGRGPGVAKEHNR